MPTTHTSALFTRAAERLFSKFAVRDQYGELDSQAAVLHFGAGNTKAVRAVIHEERSDIEFDERQNTVRVQRREIDVLTADLTVEVAGVSQVLQIPARTKVQLGSLFYTFESAEDQEPFVRLTLRRDPLARLNMMEDQGSGAV